MFDNLEDILKHYEELMAELASPDVANNQEKFRKLMKEQSDLTPLVEAYTEYKKCKQDIEDSIIMLEEEKDPDMKSMLEDEIKESEEMDQPEEDEKPETVHVDELEDLENEIEEMTKKVEHERISLRTYKERYEKEKRGKTCLNY